MTSEKLTPAEKRAIAAEEAAWKMQDEIRCEAYGKYRSRCESREPGSQTEDWLAAERAVLARRALTAAGPVCSGRTDTSVPADD